MNKIKKIFKFIALTLLVVNLVACSSVSDQEILETQGDNVSEGEKLVIRLPGGDAGLPNPHRHIPRGPGISKTQLIYDSLIEKNENGNIPWLAKSWQISQDGLVYTFEIQDNVLWHDGVKLTPEDVKFTFDYYENYPPAWNTLISSDEYIIKSTEIIDDNKVKITVKEPSADNITHIGFMRILPKHIWENIEDPNSFEGEGSIVGCGPYNMEVYNPEQGIYRFESFQDYWGLKQKADAIEWVPVSDPVLAFENEEIDIINASPDIVPKYEKDDNYKVEKKHSYHTYKLMMNMDKREEFSDPNVRKALAYAIDREDLMDKVERGSAIIGSMGYVPEVHSYYNDNIEKYDYDIEKAKELLGGKKHSFKLLIGNGDKEVKIAELMKISLGEVGIDLQVESIDSKARDSAIQDDNYELVLVIYGGLGGGPGYLKDIYGSAGEGSAALPGYRNKKIEEISKKQEYELDEKKRKDMIFQLQELIAEDVPQIVIYGPVDNHVFRPSKYDGWMFRYDHTKTTHNKLSYLERDI